MATIVVTKKMSGLNFIQKSYPFGWVKLSTKISDVNFFYPEELSKKNISRLQNTTTTIEKYLFKELQHIQ